MLGIREGMSRIDVTCPAGENQVTRHPFLNEVGSERGVGMGASNSKMAASERGKYRCENRSYENPCDASRSRRCRSGSVRDEGLVRRRSQDGGSCSGEEGPSKTAGKFSPCFSTWLRIPPRTFCSFWTKNRQSQQIRNIQAPLSLHHLNPNLLCLLQSLGQLLGKSSTSLSQVRFASTATSYDFSDGSDPAACAELAIDQTFTDTAN